MSGEGRSASTKRPFLDSRRCLSRGSVWPSLVQKKATFSPLGPYFFSQAGDLLEDELLGAGHAHIGGGVGSGLEGPLDAEVLAGLFHDRAAAAEALIGHVAGEGDVHEGLGAHFLGGPDDGVAAGDEVLAGDEVGGAGDDLGILVGFAGESVDVGALGLDALEGFGGPGNRLVDDDGLHEGVVSEGDHAGDEGLLLVHEVVGIGQVAGSCRRS